MRQGSLERAWVVVLAASAAAPAWGARPFVTDDARIVEPGGYQIETYIKDQRRESETEFWFLPAHNFGGAVDRMEWTLGGTVAHSDALSNSNQVVFQAKTLVKPLPENGLGLAFTVGVARVKPGTAQDVPTQVGPVDVPGGASSSKSRVNPFVNFIASYSVLGGQFVFHGNAGLYRETQEDFTQTTWGLAAEIFQLWRLYPIAEIYGTSGEKPATQVGFRFWAIRERWQIDGTVGSQSADPQSRRWVTLGVRLLW
jgi:hypothetical protein